MILFDGVWSDPYCSLTNTLRPTLRTHHVVLRSVDQSFRHRRLNLKLTEIVANPTPTKTESAACADE